VSARGPTLQLTTTKYISLSPYLQGCAGQQEPSLRVEVDESLPTLALKILDILGFV
jgi:hypothetical protein